MNNLATAVLLNMFVLPGTGQLLQKRRLRGWLYIVVSALALLLLFRIVYNTVKSILENNAGAALNADISVLTEQVSAELMQQGGTLASYAVIAFLLTWVVALLDALACGLKARRMANP